MQVKPIKFASSSNFQIPSGNMQEPGVAEGILAAFEANQRPFKSAWDLQRVAETICGRYECENDAAETRNLMRETETLPASEGFAIITQYLRKLKKRILPNTATPAPTSVATPASITVPIPTDRLQTALLANHVRSARVLYAYLNKAADAGNSYAVEDTAREIIEHGKHAMKLGFEPAANDPVFSREETNEAVARVAAHAHARSALVHLEAFEKGKVIYGDDPISAPRVARIIGDEIVKQFGRAAKLSNLPLPVTKDEVERRVEAIINRVIDSSKPPKKEPPPAPQTASVVAMKKKLAAKGVKAATVEVKSKRPDVKAKLVVARPRSSAGCG